MRQRHAVIIGGGLGGLALSLRLASKGWAVTVCEQGESFGGKMNSWCRQGFRFDTGPSLITMPWVFAELFKLAGHTIEDHLELVPIHPISEYIYPDGVRFVYSASMPEWLQTVRQLERRDVDGFLRFMKLGAQLYEVSKETFLRRQPRSWPRASDRRVLKHLPWRYGWGNYHRTVAAHFRSPHLQQLYDRYPTYVGSSPYRSPATLAVIPYIEYAFGGWYIKGGLYRLIESLVELAGAAGVDLRLRSRVERIEHRERRVSGIRLSDGVRMAAEAVIMNGDVSMTPQMLGDVRPENGKRSSSRGGREPGGRAEGLRSELPHSERSMSGLVFLLGLKRTMPELHHHAIYFSADYHREFSELFDQRRFPSEPTVYVNTPSRSDRSVVPGEGETLFVMANAPANDDDEWNEEQLAVARRRVFSQLRACGFPEIDGEVAVSEVWTPRRIGARYSMPGGAIYGTNSHGWRNAFLRPGNKDRHYAGLYYVGGSTHPGGGTPTVLLSAQITGELIERYEGA